MGRPIGVLDYGVGNLGSVLNMFRHIGVEAEPVRSAEQVANASKLLLPGVGAFDYAMKRLDELELVEPIRAYAAGGGSILGICLGMQLLLDSSEEGQLPGLGLIPGKSQRLVENRERRLRVPHMGWNSVVPRNGNALLHGMGDENRFYFVHSFHAVCNDDADVYGETVYGNTFSSMIGHEAIYGAQFHPEKSHHFGMKLLANFAGGPG